MNRFSLPIFLSTTKIGTCALGISHCNNETTHCIPDDALLKYMQSCQGEPRLCTHRSLGKRRCCVPSREEICTIFIMVFGLIGSELLLDIRLARLSLSHPIVVKISVDKIKKIKGYHCSN